MKKTAWISVLFYFSGIYDGLLGLIFLLYPLRLFERLGITPPNHVGYVEFPAALLLIFALIFFRIARNPSAYRNLIPYGMLLKVAYCSVVICHWIGGGIPYIWKPFAVADAIMLLLYVWAWFALDQKRAL